MSGVAYLEGKTGGYRISKGFFSTKIFKKLSRPLIWQPPIRGKIVKNEISAICWPTRDSIPREFLDNSGLHFVRSASKSSQKRLQKCEITVENTTIKQRFTPTHFATFHEAHRQLQDLWLLSIERSRLPLLFGPKNWLLGAKYNEVDMKRDRAQRA